MEVDRNVAEGKVRGPAIGLIVAAILGVLVQLVAIAWDMVSDAPAPWETGEVDIPRWAVDLGESMGIVLTLISFAVAGFMVFAGIKLMRLESYVIVLIAAIVALVPCISPCCCFSLPIGIWALVVMHAPDVRPAFR
jgi:hypothetical protein